MNEFLPFIVIIILIVALTFLVMVVKQMSDEIGDLKEKLEQHRIRFNYLEFDYSSISDIEDRLDKLEEFLELKDFYEQEPLNEKEDENNQTIC